MKKVAIIGTAGVPSKYGGFETLAHQLVYHLGEKFRLSVYCSTKYYPSKTRVKYFQNARLFYIPLNANGIQSIFYDFISIIHALFYADVLVVLGVSGAMILPFVRWFTNKKIIVSIDGLEWRRAKWNRYAKWLLHISEKIAMKYAHADISDNEAIQDYTASTYGTLSTIVEYGGDHTMKVTPKLTRDDYDEYPFLREPYAFTVCRIEPENNIHIILESFRAFKDKRKNIVIIGNWDSSEYGKELRRRYGHRFHYNIHLLDPIYDQEKLDKIRANCHIYLHGHSAGGTNPSLVEAMTLGLPIIAFDVNYNRTTTENKALFFKDHEDLTKILAETDSGHYIEMRPEMRKIAERRYRWAIIAKKYEYLIYKVGKNSRSLTSPVSTLSKKELIDNDLGHFVHPSMFFERT